MQPIRRGTPAGWLTGGAFFAGPVFLVLSVPSWRISVTGIVLAFVFGFLSLSCLVLAGREHWLGEGRTQGYTEAEKVRTITSASAFDSSLSAALKTTGAPVEIAHPDSARLGAITTRDEIYRYIRSLPPLQQEDAARNYIGIEIIWEGKISHLRKLATGKIFVLAACRTNGTGIADTKFEVDNYPGLALIPEGTPIKITGTINDIDIVMVGLSNAHFEVQGGG